MVNLQSSPGGTNCNIKCSSSCIAYALHPRYSLLDLGQGKAQHYLVEPYPTTCYDIQIDV